LEIFLLDLVGPALADVVFGAALVPSVTWFLKLVLRCQIGFNGTQ
jgi:hypothetical protein